MAMKTYLGCLLAFALAVEVEAASISINFYVGTTDASLVDAGEAATQFQSLDGANWNNVFLANINGAPTNFITASTGGNFIPLRDASGNTNAAQLTSTLPADMGFCNFSTVTPEPQLSSSGEAGLMSSYILIGGNFPDETLTVSGLGTDFTANGYKVYLFFDIGLATSPLRTLGYSLSDGGNSNIFWTGDTAGDNSDTNDDGVIEWRKATGITSGSATAGANYTLYEGLSGSNFTVSVTGSKRGAISGIQIVANAGAAPVISSFTATPGTVLPGGTSTLDWQVSGADSIVISGIGAVAASGTTNVTPAVSTTYTLTASNAFSTVTANAAVTVTQGPVDVYLLGGQSNMQGKGNITSIPAGQETISGVLYYHSPTVVGATSPNTLYTNVTPTGSTTSYFGPEIGFANHIKALRPGAPMALIKYAVGGTSLIWDWRSGADATDTANWGSQYSGFVNTVDGGLAALRAAGYQPQIVGMLWQQGEADAKDGWEYTTSSAIPGEANAGSLYESNLVHFIARVREQFAADIAPEGLRFVQGTVLPYAPAGGDVVTRFLARDTINAAKFNVDENSGASVAVSNTSTIACDEIITPTRAQILPATGDEVHMAAEGQLMLGKLMAEHMQAPDFSSWSASNSITNGPAGDDDGDGLSNVLEFFLGTDAKSPNSSSDRPSSSTVLLDAGSGPTNYFVMSFQQDMVHAASAFSWQVDGSTNLNSWAAPPFTPVLVDRTSHTDGTATFRYRTARPMDADPQSFLCLRLTIINP
ncbi:MAG: sialate O-acetylesterase [Kiritimatiellales bacterium]|nr:sialate O-acetylesterase [Kiritimatiellales bacterium]MCF7864260.1 sialate O-acetylesterase [Kiritimatiellales bacterium]